MFVAVVDKKRRITLETIRPAANSLRRSFRPPVSWVDPRRCASVSASTAGLLPEDIYDTQPLIDDALVFASQARLDNRDELLQRLAVPPSERMRIADSELLRRCYVRWGQQCVQKLVGDYAFVAWHRDSEELVATIDHGSACTLFYCEHDGMLVVSPQLATVVAHPQVPRNLDLQALGALFAPKSLLGTTPYSSVKALLAGHSLYWNARGSQIERWWLPSLDARTYYRDPRDYVASASALLETAVKAQLRTMGSAASTLSGGLDSTIVTAMAARELARSGAEITAYTSVPESGLTCAPRRGCDASDLQYATAVARLYPNIRHIPVEPGGLCSLDLVPAIHAYSRTPVRNGGNHLWLGRISAQASASGARVLLTGQRGNASVSAEGEGVVGTLIADGNWRDALKRTLELRRFGDRPLRREIGQIRRLTGHHRAPDSVLARFPGTQFLKADVRDHLSGLLTDDLAGLAPNDVRVSFLTKLRRPWSADPLVQWGIQWRDPTNDRRLVEHLLSYPLEAFTINGRYRGLAREIALGLLPEQVRLRQSRGLQIPELPSIIAAHATQYRRIFDEVRASALFRSLCDVAHLGAAITGLIDGSLDHYQAATVDRALDVGLFVAAHEAAA